MGRRVSAEWIDFVYLEGFSHSCLAWRQRRSPLIVTGNGLTERRITGSASAVLAEVLTWQTYS